MIYFVDIKTKNKNLFTFGSQGNCTIFHLLLLIIITIIIIIIIIPRLIPKVLI